MNLQSCGFTVAGKWMLKNSVKSGITFELTTFAQERVLYAFVVDDQPKYIGICERDRTLLKGRMSRYKNLTGAGTNERVAAKIKKCLEDSKPVQILALKPDSKCEYLDLKVDLVKGLENPLIEKFKPEWNRSIVEIQGRK